MIDGERIVTMRFFVCD